MSYALERETSPHTTRFRRQLACAYCTCWKFVVRSAYIINNTRVGDTNVIKKHWNDDKSNLKLNRSIFYIYLQKCSPIQYSKIEIMFSKN